MKPKLDNPHLHVIPLSSTKIWASWGLNINRDQRTLTSFFYDNNDDDDDDCKPYVALHQPVRLYKLIQSSQQPCQGGIINIPHVQMKNRSHREF